MTNEPEDSSQPRLARGCRWGGTDENPVVLFPEGAISLEGPGKQILEQCDGVRTLKDIVDRLTALYKGSDPEQIRRDVSLFLQQLQQKRIVDY
ncbi:MAG TPA: pyrroloquinoline quinone biosynthesis peptide chaperone PqqD [Candidatus Angelobacter sp.]|nr:pyrroloquinoline quinone biosynthesis peptide chaperone PqqD [Candidatus Angelobacter sp.]